MASVLVLTADEVRHLLPLDVLVPVIEEAFRDNSLGGSLQYDVVREMLPEYGGIFGIKSGFIKESQLLGLKAGGFWANNAVKHGLPAHQSTMLLFNPETGQPTALLDANPITTQRTGAAGAVAAKHLARKDSKVAAIIGAGVQGSIQLRALAQVLPLKQARVYDANASAAARYVDGAGDLPFPVQAASTVDEAATGADVIVTTTPSFKPVLLDRHVAPGVHINAMGSDTRGKQEIEETLFSRASLFVDNIEQARTLGETQHAIGKGIITESHIKAELGQVIAGTRTGRTNAKEITVFDATGVSFQDLVAAGLAVNRARELGLGRIISL